ncbi:MAG: tRNA (adenosine(37)-N6)-dimethylallyltransferase MiaA [Vagococcus sp.]
MEKKQKVLVIVGPTAVGKTALSIHMAKRFNGQIISGDSLQVYRQLDIGTAKATEEEQDGIIHHLLDIKEATDTYSAHDFKKEAESKIVEIHQTNELPIIAGGTGMYIQSLLFDFQLGSNESEQDKANALAFRDEMACLALEKGNQEVWNRLNDMDPLGASKIHPNNLKRVIRGIEVFEKTGMSILNQQTVDFKKVEDSVYDVKIVGLYTDRSILYDRINQRVDIMIGQGLVEEAHYVYELGKTQASQGIGYKEFFPYFEGSISLEEAIDKVKQHSRQYAKRQLTWFRNRMSVEWWDLVQTPSQLSILEKEIEKWYLT